MVNCETVISLTAEIDKLVKDGQLNRIAAATSLQQIHELKRENQRLQHMLDESVTSIAARDLQYDRISASFLAMVSQNNCQASQQAFFTKLQANHFSVAIQIRDTDKTIYITRKRNTIT